MHDFIIKSLDYRDFSRLFLLNDVDLEKEGAVRMKANSYPGFPCRVSLEDAHPGEEVILISYPHHLTDSPYRSSGPIFVRKNAKQITWNRNEIPSMLLHRLLSLRAYDRTGMMKQAIVMDGLDICTGLHLLFDDMEIAYIHIHNAKPGCYNCMAIRV